MPVYNALPYLDEAVESILTQTRPDFEFVIYDDASTDGSSQRLEEWARRLSAWAEEHEVFAYFNNDWNGYAVRNGLWLRQRLGV